jgi:hypothetical protein
MTRVIIVKVQARFGVHVTPATLPSHLLNRCRWVDPMGARITDAMIKRQIFLRVVAVGLALRLSACTNPYDPVQRTVGGGLIGAGSGAAIGAAAGGGHGAALGAAVGGAVGAAGGLITTPPPPRYRY